MHWWSRHLERNSNAVSCLCAIDKVNHRRKRVTITFRGSVTDMDWATNYEIYMKDVENPLRKHAGQPETVRFHNGFHKYMFGPNSHGSVKGPNGEDLSQYQEIFQEHLLPILKRNLGYKVRNFCLLRLMRATHILTNQSLSVCSSMSRAILSVELWPHCLRSKPRRNRIPWFPNRLAYLESADRTWEMNRLPMPFSCWNL